MIWVRGFAIGACLARVATCIVFTGGLWSFVSGKLDSRNELQGRRKTLDELNNIYMRPFIMLNHVTGEEIFYSAFHE